MTTAVLLAGGRSVRMGRDKPTLELGGEPLVARHVRQLRLVGIEHVLVIANATNRGAIAAAVDSPGVRVVPQEGPAAEGAVLTGLRLTECDGPVYIVCTNDIVPDDTYARLAASPDIGIQVVTARTPERFVGGLTVFAEDGRVARIDERPAGGCPPGSWANVFIHRFATPALTGELARGLAGGAAYETALNALMAATEARALPVEPWVAIKESRDLERARRAFVAGISHEGGNVTRTEYREDLDAPKPTTFLPAASTVVSNERGEVLMQRRKDNALWALPAGIMELGESIGATAIRETREETGFDIEIDGIVGIYSDPRNVVAFGKGDVRQQINICFRGRVTGGSLRCSGESTDVRWVAREELDHLALHASTRLRLRHFFELRDRPYVG